MGAATRFWKGSRAQDCWRSAAKSRSNCSKSRTTAAPTTSTTFFERIIAKHYVFSGNGEHGNPERESLEMLLKARGDNDYTIHLTYPIEEIDQRREEHWKKEQNKEKKRKAKNSDQEVRLNWSKQENSLRAFFDAHGGLEDKVEIVDEKKSHVIDLLDPVPI